MPEFKPRFSSKKPFQKKSFNRDAPKQMFRADCNKCGDVCEVPFRPNGSKPVFCNNCFERDESSAQRPAFRPRREFAPAAPARDDRALQAIKIELAGVNDKLGQLIKLMTPADTTKAKAVRTAVKKVLKKK